MEPGQVTTIFPAEVKERMARGEKLTIIDVREDDEVAQGMIPGAKQIRLSEIPDRISEIDKNSETIFVCRSGGRSGRACEYLLGEGYKNIKSLAGGMKSWSEEE